MPAGPASTAGAPAVAAHGASGPGVYTLFSTVSCDRQTVAGARASLVVCARARNACDAYVSPSADAPPRPTPRTISPRGQPIPPTTRPIPRRLRLDPRHQCLSEVEVG
jgi:hypothetical protein